MNNSSSQILPGIITSITVQKKNKSRYSIFVDDEFLIGVSESTLLEMDLAKGVKVTPFLLNKIKKHEGRTEAKAYLMKLLARRDHARKELEIKSQKKGLPREVVTDVMDELEQKGYIDEKSFALKFTNDKCNLNKWGPSKIRAHLLKKGINKKIIDRSIDEVFEDFDFKGTFLNLVLKRKRRFLNEDNPIKRKKKVFDHLLRKGFRSGDIYKHIDELMEAISDE